MTAPILGLPPLPPAPQLAYRCNECGRTSHHPGDVKERYCGQCHLHETGDIIIVNRDDPWLPGHHPIIRYPGWGCSIVAHAAFGWCSGCPQVNGNAELVAWRLHAGRNPVPGYAGAVHFSRTARG